MLTDPKLRNTKPAAKAFKLYDQGGLYVIVNPNGSIWWRLKYRIDGKEKTLSLGTYPKRSLKQARADRDEAQALLADGTDPSEARKQAKQATKEQATIEALKAQGAPLPDTLAAIAREWLEKQTPAWAPTHAEKMAYRLEKLALPYLGDRPVREITAPDVLAVLRRIEERGKIETAHRVKQAIGQVLRYAIATGRLDHDVTAGLKGAMAPRRPRHFAAPTEIRDLPPLLRKLHGYNGSPFVCAALKLAPMLFVRPGELRAMRWADVDLEAAQWRYLVTKTKTQHIVPLARQALAILRDELLPLRRGEFVFPGARSASRPMSEGAMTAALKSMQIDTANVLTTHGLRATARTLIEEVLKYPPHVIEMQLAHTVRDPNGRAYIRTTHLKERVRMMQQWADFLEELREGCNVVTADFGRTA